MLYVICYRTIELQSGYEFSFRNLLAQVLNLDSATSLVYDWTISLGSSFPQPQNGDTSNTFLMELS